MRPRFLLGKIFWALVTIWVVITFNFVLFRVLPGDPATRGVKDQRLSAEAVASLEERFGLDKPLFFNTGEGDGLFDSQYFRYLGALAQGDFGTSYAQPNRPVRDILAEALVNTVTLVLPAQVLTIVLGAGLGILAAWRRGKALDTGALTFGLFLWSLPTFFLGIVLLFYGSSWFGLPTAGRQTIATVYDSWLAHAADVGKHMILPTLTLALGYLGSYLLIMRSSILDVFTEDYILTAKAKGLNTFQVIRRHAIRNAMLPIATLIALDLGFVVAGAVEVEAVFSWQGIGLLTVNAIDDRDYPILQAAFLLISVAVIFTNLVVELLYGFLDPRVSTA